MARIALEDLAVDETLDAEAASRVRGGFVQALYQDLLGRGAPPGGLSWSGGGLLPTGLLPTGSGPSSASLPAPGGSLGGAYDPFLNRPGGATPSGQVAHVKP